VSLHAALLGWLNHTVYGPAITLDLYTGSVVMQSADLPAAVCAVLPITAAMCTCSRQCIVAPQRVHARLVLIRTTQCGNDTFFCD
jgi:hypothetical protein